MKLKTASLSLTLAALFFLPSQALAAESFELKFQSLYAGPHILNRAMYQPGLEELQKESGGRLNFQFLPSGAIAKSEDALPALTNGLLDGAGVGPQYQPMNFPNTMAFTIPYISKDSVQASALFWKAYSTLPEVRSEWDKQMKLLTIWGSDRSGFFSTVGPILSPKDVQGKTVIIWNGTQTQLIKSWGGVPVQVSPNDTYQVMKRGVGQIFFGPLPVGVAYKLMEVTPDVTIFPANTIFLVNGINWEVWESLPKDLQDMIEAKFGGEQASIRSGRLLYDQTNKDLETMKGAGCSIHALSDTQIKSFRDMDYYRTMDFWLGDLRRLGNQDPAGAIQRAYDMAAATPAAE